MKKVLSLFTALSMILSIIPVFADSEDVQDRVTIYVAANGSDMNPGTEEQPLATIKGARDKIREIKKKNKPIDVIFHSGEYPITETVFFDETDTGSEKAPITYKSAGDGEVLFTAGIELDVSKFQPVTDQNILSRLPKESIGYVGQLDLSTAGVAISQFNPYGRNRGFYLNGRKQKVAKWPNSNFEYIKEIVGGSTFKYSDNRAASWVTASDMYIEGYLEYEWTGGAYRCEVNPGERTIKVNGSGVNANRRWRAINLIEEMDIPGEFYVDTDNAIMYYYPEKLMNPSEDRLIFNRWALNMLNVKNCDYLNFDGLSFGYTDGSCMEMDNVNYIDVRSCTFKCANDGLGIYTSSHVTVENNNVYEMSRTGISVYQNPKNSSISVRPVYTEPNFSHIVIRNNYLSNCMIDYIGSTGNLGFDGVGTLVEHNIVTGGTTQGLIGAGPDCIIQYNDVGNVSRETADVGAYYSGCSWTIYGNTVQYNYIHDIGDGKFSSDNHVDCVFWDDAVSGQRARFNILRPNSNQRTNGVIIGGGSDNIIEGNIIVDSRVGFTMQDRTGTTTKTVNAMNQRTYTTLKPQVEGGSWMVKKYPQMKRIYDSEYYSPNYNTAVNNVMVGTMEPVVADYIKNSPTTVYEGNYNTDDYSIFVNPEKQDFRIKKSAKEELGLDDSILDEDFDISLIGIQREMPDVDRSFYKTYPKNGSKGFDPENITLSWQRSLFADEYYYEIATDLEFNNIVQSGKTIYNNVLLAPLQENTSYYWRVTARNISLKFQSEIMASGDPYLFTTSKHINIIDYTTLKARINNAKLVLNDIKEGDKIGEHKDGTRAELQTAIDIAQLVADDKKATQLAIYNADDILAEAINKAKYSVHVGFKGTVDTNITNWQNLSAAKIEMQQNGDELTFAKAAGGGIATTAGNIPNYGIYSFMVKEDGVVGDNPEATWFAIALNHTVNNANSIYDGGGLSTCYFLVKQHKVELQAINQTGKRQLRETVQNDGFYDFNDWIRVEYGVVPMGQGMFVYLKMNDRQVFQTYDPINPTVENGMMCISPASKLTLKPIADAKTDVEFIPDENLLNVNEGLHYYDLKDSECSMTGNWETDTSVEGYDGTPVMTTVEKGADVVFDVIPANIIGYYNVSVYNTKRDNMDKNASLEILGLYTSYTTKLDLSKEEEGWVDLGTFNFADESQRAHLRIRFIASGEGELPINAIKVEKANEDKVSFLKLFDDNPGIVLRVDNKYAYVNGLRYTLDSNPIVENDRTLIPLRFVTEAYDGEVSWNDAEKTADIVIGNKHISFRQNENTYSVNGETKQLDQPAIIVNDRIMIPIRVVSEEINKEVYWDMETKVIVIADKIDENVQEEAMDMIKKEYGIN